MHIDGVPFLQSHVVLVFLCFMYLFTYQHTHLRIRIHTQRHKHMQMIRIPGGTPLLPLHVVFMLLCYTYTLIKEYLSHSLRFYFTYTYIDIHTPSSISTFVYFSPFRTT